MVYPSTSGPLVGGLYLLLYTGWVHTWVGTPFDTTVMCRFDASTALLSVFYLSSEESGSWEQNLRKEQKTLFGQRIPYITVYFSKEFSFLRPLLPT